MFRIGDLQLNTREPIRGGYLADEKERTNHYILSRAWTDVVVVVVIVVVVAGAAAAAYVDARRSMPISHCFINFDIRIFTAKKRKEIVSACLDNNIYTNSVSRINLFLFRISITFHVSRSSITLSF